jgi:hypothetical protein
MTEILMPTERIRLLNEQLRITGTGGRFVLARGIVALPEAKQRAILQRCKIRRLQPR